MQDPPELPASVETQPEDGPSERSHGPFRKRSGRSGQRKRWPFIVGAVAVIAIGAGSTTWFVVNANASESGAQTITSIQAASLATFDKTVSTTGALSPSISESISFEASGTVQTVEVAAGDTVTKGQVLATIDTLQLKANLLQAQAALAEAQATLADAKSSGSTSVQIASAQAQVDLAQANVATAEADMAKATLTAPESGQITSVSVAVGDVVVSSSNGSSSDGSTGGGGTGSGSGSGSGTGSGTGSGDSSGTSTTAFTLVGTDSWSVDVTVSASDLANLTVGDQAEITVDGVDTPVFGTVSSLSKVATTSNGSEAFPVTVTITGTPKGLYDGVSASVNLIYERRVDVLSVPANAVKSTGGTFTVQKMVDGKPVETTVEVGESNGQLTEITSGLEVGDEVQISTTIPSKSDTGKSGTDTGDRGMIELPGGMVEDRQLPEGGFPAEGPVWQGNPNG